MTNLYLPDLPASPMFMGDESKTMTIEWQEFFRSLFDRVGGTTGPSFTESDISSVVDLYDTPKNYAKRIDDLENKIISEIFIPSKEIEMDIHTSLGKFKIQKDLTFSNDTGTVNLFIVTGDVFVNIIAIVTTNVASAASANIRLGITGNTDSMIIDTLSTDMAAREIWNDSGISNEIENLDSIRKYIITDGNNISLTLDAQVDSGAMTFHCFWSPLSSNGKVEVA